MKNNKIHLRDNWQVQYQDWKDKSSLESSSKKATPEQIKMDIEEIFIKPLKPLKPLKPSSNNPGTEKKETSYSIFIAKIIIIIIAFSIIGFVIYSNYIASHEFVYFYEIGGNDDITKNYLGPNYRVSEVFQDENNSLTYRDLTSQLVYFDVPIARGSKDLLVEVKFKDDYPLNSKMIMGARNGNEWNYVWKDVYVKKDDSLSQWKNQSVSFYLNDDKLYLRDGKLSLVFNNYHLHPDRNQTNTNYISIDWIRVTVNKPGVFDK